MTKLSGVLDANVVIGLVRGGVFHLLPAVYSPLFIPTEVTSEVVGPGRVGSGELSQALGKWVVEVRPDPHLVQQIVPSLSWADRQILAVAREQAVDHILSGDGRVRREALRLGLACLRTTDVLVLLKRFGHLREVRSTLEQMRQSGFGIDDALYQETLRAAGESRSAS